MVNIDIQMSEIVKIITHFSKPLQLIFVYTKPSCATYIRSALEMAANDRENPYYHPLSRNEQQKKLVFIVETIDEAAKNAMRTIFPKNLIEEISNRDANELLVRSTGTQQAVSAAVNASLNADNK